MLNSKTMRHVLFSILLLFASVGFAFASDLHPELGILTTNETTLNLEIGARYNAYSLRADVFGYSRNKHDGWLTLRAILGYRFFADLPYSIEPGISVGYLYAKAPNKFHQDFNEANEGKYLLPINQREYLDGSLSFAARLYGFQSTILVPVFFALNNVKPRFLWTFGYIFEL